MVVLGSASDLQGPGVLQAGWYRLNNMRWAPVILTLATIVAVAGSVTVAYAQASPKWRLVWADEFTGSAGSVPDHTKWTYDIGDGGLSNVGWGNKERQFYTSSAKNVFLDGKGHLVIRVLKEGNRYTSGRIKTQGRFTFQYGKIEARIKVPYGYAIWPAFWLLGSDWPIVPWPSCGEIDVMENFGAYNSDKSRIYGVLHGPGFAAEGVASVYQLPNRESVSSDFHTFSIEWSRDRIEFFVDEHSYMLAQPQSLPRGARWVFNDGAFFIILNVAVGGYPAPVGYPDQKTVLPQEMVVDYVRVYRR